MEKPWKIFGTLPTLHNKEFGSYRLRGDAEQDALTLQRIMGKQVRIRVVWSPDND